MSKVKLLKIIPSKKDNKKYTAFFILKDKIKKVDFGGRGYSDYTIHKDPERKKLYIKRHRKNENWKDPVSPGALSRWVLWNFPSFKKSIQDYKRRFKL
tara:strand:- start:718 stop:1011 length:294 start_codon:yes stop_codon:yes gene_type:complete